VLEEGHCIDPVQILWSEPNSTRCRADTDCPVASAEKGGLERCLHLDKKERILRIGYVSPPFFQRSTRDGDVHVLLWSGPKLEVFQQVAVGTTLPSTRLGLFILRHPLYWLDIFFDYLQMISLSLFIFNLIPITVLDGGHLLEILLDEISPTFIRLGLGSMLLFGGGRKSVEDEEAFVELEELESGTRSRNRDRGRSASFASRSGDTYERRTTKDVLKVVNYVMMGMALLLLVDSVLRDAG